jgi:hypothetical protein
MVSLGVAGSQPHAGWHAGGNQRDGRLRTRRRHLDPPAARPERHVAPLLETELADIELDRPVLIGDGDADQAVRGTRPPSSRRPATSAKASLLDNGSRHGG